MVGCVVQHQVGSWMGNGRLSTEGITREVERVSLIYGYVQPGEEGGVEDGRSKLRNPSSNFGLEMAASDRTGGYEALFAGSSADVFIQRNRLIGQQVEASDDVGNPLDVRHPCSTAPVSSGEFTQQFNDRVSARPTDQPWIGRRSGLHSDGPGCPSHDHFGCANHRIALTTLKRRLPTFLYHRLAVLDDYCRFARIRHRLAD